MGRRPNQLVLEYFERGPKLEDASNRYQHTCKSCGEKFPKGRIDSLTNHLVKKCPALPLHDRQRALLQFHELPLPVNMAQTVSPTASPNQMLNGQKINLAFAPHKPLSALETLAEVSRQHLDLSGKRAIDKLASHNHNNINHAGLLDEFLIHDDRSDPADLGMLSHTMDMSSTPVLPTMYQFNGPLHHSPATSPSMSHLPLPTSGSIAQMVPSLVMAASAANDLMPLGNSLSLDSDIHLTGANINSMEDKFFHPQGRGQWPNLPPDSLDPLLHDDTRIPILSRVSYSNKNMQNSQSLSQSSGPHFTTDFSMNQKPSKPKVRGRFSDSRRKEVQEVRKRGACIRCRMLKKPCSGETPCNTCQNVDSARLWKQPCIRTRIAEEFGLYSAGLHSILSYHATNQAKGQIRLNQTPGRIEATHYPDKMIFATFTPLRYQQLQSNQHADIDPAIFAAKVVPDLEIIDSDDDVGGKLDQYVKKVGSHFFDTERSGFMKITANTASSMSASDPEGLLTKVLELWNLTRILTSPDLEWHLFSNSSLAPSMNPTTMSSTDLKDAARTSINSINQSSSYDLIRMQLMGATEKRAACLARIVMNDLERRLLQRQQANPFETFLVAVILLACVERMCWLFRTWETQSPQTVKFDPDTMEHPTSDDLDLVASALRSVSAQSGSMIDGSMQTPRHPRWPLDKSPAFFSQQGERFSDILNMLLKMRGVPPKPIARSTDGMLVMWGDDVDEKVTGWYDRIAVTTQLLDERQNAQFTGENSQEWELKYVGKIIRGD